eukprot:gene4111-7397_t
MSWFDYVDQLCKSGGATKALICGLDGTIWAQTEVFFQNLEFKEFVEGMKYQYNLMKKTPTCGGQKIRITKLNQHYLYGLFSSNSGICCVKTKSTIIIAYFESPIVGSHCCFEVEKIKQYLESCGM